MLNRREIVLLCLAFLISLPAVTTRLYASDEIEHFAWLRSLAFDRDVSFENEYQYFYDAGVARGEGFHETFLELTNETGRRINYAPIGAAVMWAPFYAAGHVWALVTGAPADGFSKPYIAAIAYGSAFYGFAAVLMCVAIARRVFGAQNGTLGASLAAWIGTPLVFYAYVAPGFGHAASAFCVSLFVWIWLRARDRWSTADAIALGLAGGLMSLVREQDVLLVIGPGIDFLLHASRAMREPGGARRTITSATAGVVSFVAGVTPQLMAYQALNGHIGQTSTAANKMSWSSPHGLQVLFSPAHGLFAWTPLALLALAGLVLIAIRNDVGRRFVLGNDARRRFALLALLMVAAQAYTSGVVESWTVAGSFGQRRFIALTPLLVIGLAGLLTAMRSTAARRMTIAAIGLCIWWNLGLMVQFGMHRMDRKTLTLAENARVTFIELPLEAPGIVWRYLTDRQSFYRQPRQ
ncbi:MAG TPA: glycosyltransferase family 39 protein [Vicinamibacterales bacterium]|nr:glycosyltransferase family 39 protein [Vicinamibacterales bacterium]